MAADRDVAVDLFSRDPGGLRFGYPGNRYAFLVDTSGNLEVAGTISGAGMADNPSGTDVDGAQNATTTPADLTDLGLTLAASRTYDFEWYIPYQQTATGNGIDLRLKSSGAPTFSYLAFSIRVQSTDTTHTQNQKTALNDPFQTAAVNTANKSYLASIFGRIITTSSGVLVPQFAIGTGAGGQVNVQPCHGHALAA